MNDIPAFPILNCTESATTGKVTYQHFDGKGLSIRDYFAAKAMHGILSNINLISLLREDAHILDLENADSLIAKDSYSIADAMLCEREKGEKK